MRNFKWFAAGLGALILVGIHSRAALAFEPGPSPTLWNYLGIPQANNKIQDALRNRFGNNPDSERTPSLKSIADPANLKSPDPTIQAAAKIKAQQDLAPQKIKAIKYLATVGCGCYQKDFGVREALVASLGDCTEEVRYEAALALAKVAGNCCDKCGNTCCNAEVMNKLKELADGTDDRCCQKETSQRVRDAARAALNACKNKLPATNVTPSTIKVEPVIIPEAPKTIPDTPLIHPETPAPLPAVPKPTPAVKPLDLPVDAPAPGPVPAPANSGKVGQAAPAASAPAEPIRLRLVIGGEPADYSGPEILETSSTSSR
jgi:hypothetical protein